VRSLVSDDFGDAVGVRLPVERARCLAFRVVDVACRRVAVRLVVLRCVRVTRVEPVFVVGAVVTCGCANFFAVPLLTGTLPLVFTCGADGVFAGAGATGAVWVVAGAWSVVGAGAAWSVVGSCFFNAPGAFGFAA
jgi:hypothetical protein